MPIKNKSSPDLTIVSLELVCDKNGEKNGNLYFEQERVPEILSGEFEPTISLSSFIKLKMGPE